MIKALFYSEKDDSFHLTMEDAIKAEELADARKQMRGQLMGSFAALRADYIQALGALQKDFKPKFDEVLIALRAMDSELLERGQ